MDKNTTDNAINKPYFDKEENAFIGLSPKPDESRLLTPQEKAVCREEWMNDKYQTIPDALCFAQDAKTASYYQAQLKEIKEKIEGEIDLEFLIRANGNDITGMNVLSHFKSRLQSLRLLLIR